MRNPAAASRGGVGHNCNRSALEKNRQSVFGHIAGEFYFRMSRALFPHRCHIARSLRVIASADNEFCVRQSLAYDLESLDHQLKTFVCSPLAECQDAMLGISAPGKIWILWSGR